MDSKQEVNVENGELTEQALSLFHGRIWTQALPALREAYAVSQDSPEVAAALGICEFFSNGVPEPGRYERADSELETIKRLLRQGEVTEWAEVSACRAWLQCLEEAQSSAEELPAAIDALKNACQQSSEFPIWSLTLRALAYYDRRQTIRELVERACNHSNAISDSLRLTLAEARLECAYRISDSHALVKDIDIQNCLPLPPEMGHLWQQWLLAELTFWQNNELETFKRLQTEITQLLETPAPENDAYSFNEWKRLTYHLALLGIRCALSLCNIEKAQQWIELASQSRPKSWEVHYFRGLISWLQGEYQNAQTALEQSLSVNPFQSRVRFELGMLLARNDPSGSQPYLNTMPGVHDAVACSAAVLFRLDKKDETFQQLEQLEQEEAPYSLRLIMPGARTKRLRQGRELRAHLAERNQEWAKALSYWDEVRQENAGSSKQQEIIYRTHRLYLLGRVLRQKNIEGGDISDKTLYTRFHKELGKLSIRHLMGDAMFYRGIAAEEDKPDRAIADWQALLRQSAWIEKTQKTAPDRLLCLGDRLLKAGLHKDAHKAYVSANTASISEAQERVSVSELIIQHPLHATHLLQTLETFNELAPNDAFWLFLRGLCVLAEEQPDYETAQTFFKQARHAGLSPNLEKLSELLPALAAHEPETYQQLCLFLDEEMSGTLPSTLRIAMEILCRPEGLKTLRRFKEIFGTDWVFWCPISPEEIFSLQLRTYCDQLDYVSALDQIQEAKEIGINITDDWKALLYAHQAIQLALSGDFESAKVLQQQVIERLLSEE